MTRIKHWVIFTGKNQEVTIPGPPGYPNITLQNGSFCYNAELVKHFPELFIPVFETVADPEDATMLLNEKAPALAKRPTPPAPPKKKVKSGGRQKGTPNKPKIAPKAVVTKPASGK